MDFQLSSDSRLQPQPLHLDLDGVTGQLGASVVKCVPGRVSHVSRHRPMLDDLHVALAEAFNHE